MKRQDLDQMKHLSPAELLGAIALERERLAELEALAGTGRLKNVRQVVAQKKKIARLLTFHRLTELSSPHGLP